MSRQPLVTVAMVTYNSGKYVSAAIQSILSSSYTNLELVICDDCSSDNSWQIVQSFSDARIRAVRNETNIGEYPNRNQCIDMARGEYFIFIDGDDIMYPHGLEFMMKMFIAFPNCVMALMYPYDGRVVFPMIVSSKQYYLNYFFGQGLLDVAFTNTLFRTNALKEAGGLSNNYKRGDDFIRLKLASKYASLIIPDQLTWWRLTPNQASQKVSEMPVSSMREMIEMDKELLLSEACPLESFEKSKAFDTLGERLRNEILKSFRKLRFAEVLQLAALVPRISGSWRVIFARKHIALDPLAKYTPANPYMLDLSLNPYTNDTTFLK